MDFVCISYHSLNILNVTVCITILRSKKCESTLPLQSTCIIHINIIFKLQVLLNNSHYLKKISDVIDCSI